MIHLNHLLRAGSRRLAYLLHYLNQTHRLLLSRRLFGTGSPSLLFHLLLISRRLPVHDLTSLFRRFRFLIRLRFHYLLYLLHLYLLLLVLHHHISFLLIPLSMLHLIRHLLSMSPIEYSPHYYSDQSLFLISSSFRRSAGIFRSLPLPYHPVLNSRCLLSAYLPKYRFRRLRLRLHRRRQYLRLYRRQYLHLPPEKLYRR